MTSQLGSEQACVRHFERKEHCSRGLKRGGAWAWAWLFLIYFIASLGSLQENSAARVPG